MKKEERIRDKLREIADYYGYEAQARQTMEECAELIEALNKQWRAKVYEGKDGVGTAKDVIGEIADVGIMLAQMVYLLNLEDIDLLDTIEAKLDRQMNRIDIQEAGQ